MKILNFISKYENKEKIFELLREILEGERRNVSAYAYGSFLKEEKFRDFDLGIFLEDLTEIPYEITSNIKINFSQLARKPGLDFKADQFDVQIINEATFTFLRRFFNEGKLLLDRSPDLRTDIIKIPKMRGVVSRGWANTKIDQEKLKNIYLKLKLASAKTKFYWPKKRMMRFLFSLGL